MEAVKQEVGIQLHLERLEFRLGQALFQFDGPEFPFPVFAIKLEGARHRDHDPIN